MPKKYGSRRLLLGFTAFVTAIAIAAGITPLAVAAPQQHWPASQWQLETPDEAANKGVVLALYDALNEGRLQFVNRAMRPDLIQHNPEVANGSAAFRKYQADLRAKFPQLRFDVKRVIVEGDLVIVHNNFVPRPGELGLAKMDLFRLSHGRIAEQWGASQDVLPPSNIGNDMFSTLSSPRVDFPLPLSTDANSKQAAVGLFDEAINERDDNLRLAALDHYIGDNTYFQHWPGVPNGSPALQQFMQDMYAAHPGYRADVKFAVAQGDLVFLFAHLLDFPDAKGSVSGDIFRVRDGKLLEHWSVVQPIPATSANPNTMY
ncbi:nuclear transport factor 2 family protein [Saccharopolyspora phatthalungensis]|uniref:Putative SnoaL-like aldol condensation-catalyzing enzyme n=1 Tax=Saccharopolyspora phatthalungensis TaxID=664693 RepID=A0A840Q1M4_9PSEU|nr:nuclear transport factor 2 family protein [Saccharopolyspora phatthalungensis]MBB5154284.1 putative SnoaL-like aldol condensation-catalyzing enzyme [Saccharopolyspora phatthalungensis]